MDRRILRSADSRTLGAPLLGALGRITAAVAVAVSLLLFVAATPATATRCNSCDGGAEQYGGIPVPEHALQSMYVISPNSLDGRHVLMGGDSIETHVTTIEPGTVQFRLTAAANVRWWKEIQIYDKWAKAQDYTRDDRKCTTLLTFNTAELSDWALLIFSKARFLGVHTGMYEIHNIKQFDGKRLEFTWIRDG